MSPSQGGLVVGGRGSCLRAGINLPILMHFEVKHEIPRALTIAGSDSGGGAGIQADLKTFAALGVYGMSAIAALTAQNTVGIDGIMEIAPDFVSLQIRAVVADMGVDAVKTGMLPGGAVISRVSEDLEISSSATSWWTRS